MSTHGFIILDFVFAFILSWLMLNFQLPSNKRHSEEIFSIIKYANKKAKKIWSEDCSTRYKKESDDKSYFTTKDIDN